MERKKFKRLALLTSLTILLTISVQFYRNVQIYKTNKQGLELEVGKSLDKAIDQFYAELARVRMTELVEAGKSFAIEVDTTGVSSTEIMERVQSAYFRNIELAMVDNLSKDSAEQSEKNPYWPGLKKRINDTALKYSLSLSGVASYLDPQLTELGIKDDKQLVMIEGGEVIRGPDLNSLSGYSSIATSKSSLLQKNQYLQLYYDIGFMPIFALGIMDFTFSIVVIGCILVALMTLYRMVYRQKELAAIKDDFLSNITHEFKTPIAAGISTLEGITMFNKDNDVHKNRKYAELALGELNKMNGLVEKLLETSSMDFEAPQLKLEQLDLTYLIKEVVENHKLLDTNKEIKAILEESGRRLGDKFYLKMAIGNLIDNALKYGGETVTVKLQKYAELVLIDVIDDGGGIDKKHRSYIFDKFYRVPTGNIHDVKGYGIGLYAARKIIEQHMGKLDLEVKNGLTIFRISL